MTAALLLVAALTSCPSTRPADTEAVTWVCIDGGWRPTSPTPAPPPPPPAPLPPTSALNLSGGFQVGRTYRRDATGVEMYISALTATKAGIAVFVAECLNTKTDEQCFFPGEGRFILANASPSGWSEIP